MDTSDNSDSDTCQKMEPRKRNEKFQDSIHHLSASDFNKIYDKTIKKGFDYQAFVPKIVEPYQETYTFKIYGYSFSRQDRGNPASPNLCFSKNEEENLIITIPRRKTNDYIQWDPAHFSSDFKVLCFRLGQFIKQNYNLDFSDYEILEYYRICRMNKGLFLNTIHSDESPFLEFVRSKRAKMIK